MTKIGICAHFNFDAEAVGGQTIKTRIVSQVLSEHYGSEEVLKLDSDNWKKRPLTFFFKCIILAIKSDNIIILPALNGAKILIPLFTFLSKILNKKLHYIVIGAWLAKLLEEKKTLKSITKKVDYIYPETQTLKRKLDEMGISENTYVMPNFKQVEPIKLVEKDMIHGKPFKLCIVSRINYKKGIESAIEVVEKLNVEHNTQLAVLDIYGPIEKEYKERFEMLLKEYDKNINYKGILDYNQLSETIRKYYLLLFPTKYYTEGFPGTILDAYLSGVPVLSSRWESWKDLIEEGKTGFTFEFDNNEDFYKKLNYLIHNVEKVNDSKINCLDETNKYKVENAIRVLIGNIW